MGDLERFWSKVDQSGGPDACWLWTRGTFADGYGSFSVGGKHGRNVKSHRFAYEQSFGPIPDGLVIDHTCHNRSDCPGGSECAHTLCVNPVHLEAVTQGVNTGRSRNTIATKNARKTHCPQGHPYDGDNLYVAERGDRQCRACHYVAVRRHRGVSDEPSERAALSDGEVVEIRDEYLKGVLTQRMLAEIYGCSKTTVARVLRGEGRFG